MRRKPGTAGKHQLASIVKRSVKNELNPRLYAPCCRAAGECAQVFVPERGGNVTVFQFQSVKDFPVVARRSGRNEPKVSICLAILAGHFFAFGQAFSPAKSAFKHRRVFRLGGGRFRHGSSIFFHASSTGDWCEFRASGFTLMSFAVIGFSLLFWLWKAATAFSLRYAFISVQVPLSHPANTFAFDAMTLFFLPARFIAFGRTKISELFVFANTLTKKAEK